MRPELRHLFIAVAALANLGLPACGGGGETVQAAAGGAPAPAPAPAPGPAPAPTPAPAGTASLSWSRPTLNADGSPLPDSGVSGYRIRYGTAPTSLTVSVDVSGATMTSYMLRDLPAATYYFSVSTLATGGTESDPSNVASLIVK